MSNLKILKNDEKREDRINNMIKEFKKIRDNRITLNDNNASLYNNIYCEMLYRTPKKVFIKENRWYCPMCELPINSKKTYIKYCDFCGQKLATPLNNLERYVIDE